MTPRFDLLLKSLAERDAGFVQLFGVAAMLVLSGILIEWLIPAQWQKPAAVLWAVSAWSVVILTTVKSFTLGG